jgi:hypothetical protein
MPHLSHTAVVANVRRDGAIGVFERRTFGLMLDQREPQHRQLREAIRILRQIGYETRSVEIEPDQAQRQAAFERTSLINDINQE